MTTAPMSENLHHPGFTVPRRMTISTESRILLWIALVGAITLSTVTFMLSFAGLHDVAAWANIRPSLRWAVPVFIDGAIIVYTVAVLVERGRGQTPWFAWIALVAFTVVSVGANGSHAWAVHESITWQTWVGTLIAALPPLGQLAATHTIARLVVDPDYVPHPIAGEVPSTAPSKVTAPVQIEEARISATPSVTSPQPDVAAQPSADLLEERRPVTAAPTRGLEIATARVARPVNTLDMRPSDIAGDEKTARDRQIVELHQEGLSQREIAARIGCGKSTVARVLERGPSR
ncbi:DUF2637 domain-containing protein [Mumia sp. zg.B21]|uniref:DUF2637 domain-containing protein n=1 Tax=Mumia sp. zg.B21 TaxID=2855447 RepID=UPI001C6F1A31|nr:DUF2637 domain-containing protein [Mumia sp. zg.B21]MBW9211771.1 DUF2637 domain-containing protein [Mumia sp. zg.B21]